MSKTDVWINDIWIFEWIVKWMDGLVETDG